MKITINGEQREVPEGLNVVAMLRYLGIAAERVAIERNLDVLPRPRWQETVIERGDTYEIIHFVGGG